MAMNESPVSPPSRLLPGEKRADSSPSPTTKIATGGGGSVQEVGLSPPSVGEKADTTTEKKDNGNANVPQEEPPRRFVHIPKRVPRPTAEGHRDRPPFGEPNDLRKDPEKNPPHAVSSTSSGGKGGEEGRSPPTRYPAPPFGADSAGGNLFPEGGTTPSSSPPLPKNRNEPRYSSVVRGDPSTGLSFLHSKAAASSAGPPPTSAQEGHAVPSPSGGPSLSLTRPKEEELSHAHAVPRAVKASSLPSLQPLRPISSFPPSPIPLAASATSWHSVRVTTVERPPGLPTSSALVLCPAPAAGSARKVAQTNAISHPKENLRSGGRADGDGVSPNKGHLPFPFPTSAEPGWTLFSYKNPTKPKGDRQGEAWEKIDSSGGVGGTVRGGPASGENNGNKTVGTHAAAVSSLQDGRAKAVLQMLRHPHPSLGPLSPRRNGNFSMEAPPEDGTIAHATSFPDGKAMASHGVESSAKGEENRSSRPAENGKRPEKGSEEENEGFPSGMVSVCGKRIGAMEGGGLSSLAPHGLSVPVEERGSREKENREGTRRRKSKGNGVQLESEVVRQLSPALLQAAATAAILVSLHAEEDSIQKKPRHGTQEHSTLVTPPLDEVLKVRPAPSSTVRLSCVTSSSSPVTKNDDETWRQEEEMKRIKERYALDEPRSTRPSCPSKITHILSQLKDAEGIRTLLAPSTETCPSSTAMTSVSRPPPLSSGPSFAASAAKRTLPFSPHDASSTWKTLMANPVSSTSSVLPLLSHPPKALLSSVCAHLAEVAAAGAAGTHQTVSHAAGSSPTRSGSSSRVGGTLPSFRRTVEEVMQHSREENLKKKLGVSHISNFADQRDITDFFTGLDDDMEALFDEL